MNTKRSFSFSFNIINDDLNNLSAVKGSRYRYSGILVFCTRICQILFVICLISAALGQSSIKKFGSYYFPLPVPLTILLYIFGGLAILLPIISMLFGKIRIVVNEEAIYTPKETIPFSDIKTIELWRAWWRFEYWLMMLNSRGQYHDLFFNSYLCIKMNDGSNKLIDNSYLCRNIIKINKYASTNIITVVIGELLKIIVLFGSIIGIFIVINIFAIDDHKGLSAFIRYLMIIIPVSLVHRGIVWFLSTHFYRKYSLPVQILFADVAELFILCVSEYALIYFWNLD